MPLGRGGGVNGVHSPLFFREILDGDRSVRAGRHLGLLRSLDASETGERTKCP